jgi:hypothetical protein
MPNEKSTTRDQLAARVVAIAEQVAECAAAALTLGDDAPSAIIICERDLRRWAEQLRRR